MWRAVGALVVVGLVWSLGFPGGSPAIAQDGYAGEAGPRVPLPAIGSTRQSQSSAQKTKKSSGRPETPARKPRSTETRKKAAAAKKKTEKRPDSPTSQSERDKYLCKALQACRNEFIRCKSKIKHPDQSEAWSIAKEECGAHYKTCVEKDFKSGEWFFTRWFYFKELDCS